MIGTEDPDVQKVTVLLTLNPDGTLAARPVVEKKAAGTMGDIAAERAVRAVIRAAPYNLPDDKYQAWKEVRVNFDPKDMF